jgi:Heterokaryon incompatibility protein (HET)
VLKVVYAGERRGVKCSLTDLKGLQSRDYHCLSYTRSDPFVSDVDYVIQYRSIFAICLEPFLSIIRKARKKLARFLQLEQYTIAVDGGFLTVTPNLWHALIHLNQTRPDELQAIWIDAICIDQDKKNEKTSQVGIMHHIYRTANSVVVWLGPEDTRNENPAVVSEAIDALHKQEEARPGFCKNMPEMVWKEHFEEFPAPDSMRSLGFEHWFYVRNFLQRAYF